MMANVVLLGGVLWIYICGFSTIASRDQLMPATHNLVAMNWDQYGIFFGMAIFAFEGIGLVLPIRVAMKNPERLPRQLTEVFVVLVLLFISFGLVGYFAYGSGVNSMVTFDIYQNEVTSFVRLFYCLGLFFSYPVQLHPVNHMNENKYRCLRGKKKHKAMRRTLLRSFLVAMSGCIALVVPHFGLFLGLIGSVACTLLAFIMPALFHLRRPDRSNATKQGDGLDWFVIVFGCVGGVLSFVLTMKDLISEFSKELAEKAVAPEAL
jgi:proton-coupled amino acid transporter